MINNLIDEYLDYLKYKKRRSASTLRNYRLYLGRFIKVTKINNPSDIDQSAVARFREFLRLYVDGKGNGLSMKTQNFHFIALRNFLRFLSKKEIKTLLGNAVELSHTSDIKLDVLSKEQLKNLLEAADKDTPQSLRDRAILELLYSTGLRVSELVNLNRNQIDLEKNEVYIRSSGSKVRTVFISRRAGKAISDYLKIRMDTFRPLFIRIKNSIRKSADPWGNDLRLTPRTVQRIVKKYGISAGIPFDVTPQTLRHSFATDLLRSGADLKSVQALLGHSTITITERYIHLTNKDLRETHEAYH